MNSRRLGHVHGTLHVHDTLECMYCSFMMTESILDFLHSPPDL